MTRDDMARVLAEAMPAVAGMTREAAAHIAANNLREQGWALVYVAPPCARCADRKEKA